VGGWVVGDGYQWHGGDAAGEGRRTCARRAIGRLSFGTRKTGHRMPTDASDWRKQPCKLLMDCYVAAVTSVGTGSSRGSKGLLSHKWDGNVGRRLNVA